MLHSPWEESDWSCWSWKKDFVVSTRNFKQFKSSISETWCHQGKLCSGVLIYENITSTLFNSVTTVISLEWCWPLEGYQGLRLLQFNKHFSILMDCTTEHLPTSPSNWSLCFLAFCRHDASLFPVHPPSPSLWSFSKVLPSNFLLIIFIFSASIHFHIFSHHLPDGWSFNINVEWWHTLEDRIPQWRMLKSTLAETWSLMTLLEVPYLLNPAYLLIFFFLTSYNNLYVCTVLYFAFSVIFNRNIIL